MAWLVAIYGCEGWMIRAFEESRLEAFEMNGLRQILYGFHGQQEKPTDGLRKKLE